MTYFHASTIFSYKSVRYILISNSEVKVAELISVPRVVVVDSFIVLAK